MKEKDRGMKVTSGRCQMKNPNVRGCEIMTCSSFAKVRFMEKIQ